jgi:hypothetical protein
VEVGHARIVFDPERPDAPGSYNSVEIRTGGDALLARLHDLCGQLARGARTECDLLRDLPAEGVGVRRFRAYLGRGVGQKVVAITTPTDGVADVEWRNTREEWEDVCRQIERQISTPGTNMFMPLYPDDVDESEADGELSVER